MKLLIASLTLLLLVTNCVPQNSGGSGKRRSSAGSSSTTGTTTTQAPAPSFASTEAMYWYSGQKIDGIITLNQNLGTVIYLRGLNVHNFLANNSFFANTYCLVADFPGTSLEKRQLRVKATPISFNNFSSGTLERLLRIDLPMTAENQAQCQGTFRGFSSASDITYSLDTVCPTCSKILTASKLSLALSSSNTISDLNLIPPSLLDISGLGMRVDALSGSNSFESTCSNSSCGLKGFDCCLDGQCVKDGSERPNAKTDTSYSQALSDISLNPLNFINWPNLYYVCSNVPHIVPTPTPLPNAETTATSAFDSLTKEYYCLEEGKKTTPNYAAGTCSDKTYTSKTLCTTAGKTWSYYCFPNGTIASFTDIQASVWLRCGCQASPFPASPEDPKCPDFGLKASFDLNGNILDITCDIPQPQVQPTPFQNLQINIPGRTIPHRFFRADTGATVEDLSTVQNEASEVLPEGTPFSYIDESGKTEPVNHENFNMNAILGQMKVNLTRARPATVINVEFDQTYIVSATKGVYTPCPQCAKDSWFDSFMAFPPSQKGRGLEAIGHITERNNYVTNVTLGNYEDTKFGRACFIPPTMIPFSHKKGLTVAAQREARLATQAALYVNGYKRDWFGFNLGALIGSFDGARWFAVGGGRRVQATSNKLYLAINAPFGDLAEPTDTTVSVILDQGNNFAADYDYDPELSAIDARQNSGATCQKYHQCETDSDCVTQLGWEYMCANTAIMKTKLPVFDLDGNEKLDEVIASGFSKILQGSLPAGSKKRCVYRGMGAPCKRTFTEGTIFPSPDIDHNGVPDSMAGNRIFACASNFYCSPLSASTFNDRIIREPNNIFSIFYGQEADFMGRPEKYLSASKLLTSTIKTNLVSNFAQYNSGIETGVVGEWGLCRPARSVSHPKFTDGNKNKDTSLRTDYISQIGGCGAESTGNTRIQSCPVVDWREKLGNVKNSNFGNFLFPGIGASGATALANSKEYDDDAFYGRHAQNMCGRESVGSNGKSIFAQIEFDKVPPNILNPGLAQNACLRRAGSICHSNLDCGPNQLHATEASNYDKSFFGNSGPEKLFWEENLICGQAEPVPFLNSASFSKYDIKKNRCCREVGKGLTMFTSGSSTFVESLGAQFTSTANANAFHTNILPRNNPQTNGRYSRYASVPLGTIDSKGVTFATPEVSSAPSYNSLKYQWKTIHETGRLTCCGGGFVRKFADGTHDWTKRDRLKIDPTIFKCLNFQSEIAHAPTDIVATLTTIPDWEADGFKYCSSPDNGIAGGGGGCYQRQIPDSGGGFEITPPTNRDHAAKTLRIYPLINPADEQPKEGLPQNIFAEAPFIPEVYHYRDASSQPGTEENRFYPWMANPTYAYTGFYLPSYMGDPANIIRIDACYMKDGETPSPLAIIAGGSCSKNVTTITRNDVCDQTTNPDAAGPLTPNTYCIFTEPSTNRKVLMFQSEVTPFPDDPDPHTFFGGLEITFRVPGTTGFNKIGGSTIPVAESGLSAGNSNYYLSKLGRLELLGIPQIFYEPVTCNSNRSKLVPGILEDAISTTSAFSSGAMTLTSSPNLAKMYGSDTAEGLVNTSKKIVFKDKVKIADIFSEHEFLCCKKLGSQTTDPGLCCSGYSATIQVNGVNQTQCLLPLGADLNVYFNRFVSSEGVGDDEPGGGLNDQDFIPETGELAWSDKAYDKIVALGEAYCQTKKVRPGAAFGNYYGEPNILSFITAVNPDSIDPLLSNRRFSMVDGPKDGDGGTGSFPTGYNPFLAGYHWNHHYYCTSQ